MSDEKKENRTNIEDLPRAEQELTSEEAKDVKGGLVVTTSTIDARELNVAVGDVNNDGFGDIITGVGPGGPHVKR